MQRNQTEQLDIRNIRNKIKSSMDGLLSRLDRVQKKITDLECMYEKNAHSAIWKYGKKKAGKYD